MKLRRFRQSRFASWLTSYMSACRAISALLATQQVARDDHSLDLRGTFIDLQQLRVAHQFLDGVFLRVPVPAENLNRIGRTPHCSIGPECLGVARRDRRQIPPVDLPR